MSHVEDLIRLVIECGAKVENVDGQLVVRAGAHPVPGKLVQRLREAKTDVLENLSPRWWRRQFAARTVNYELGGARSHEEAARLAWGELECRWHRLYGKPIPEWQCAGCSEPIGGQQALPLGGSNRVHLDDCHGLDCVIRYGERWRSEATRGLIALHLRPPAEKDAP